MNKEGLEALEAAVAVQTTDGNWNYSPYMHGMANGLILALMYMKGEDYEPLEAPDEWLADKPGAKINVKVAEAP